MSGPVELRNEIAAIFRESLEKTWGDDLPDDFLPEITVPGNRDFGDIACNAPLQLAGVLKKSPRAIASGMLEHAPACLPGVDRVSVDGPGFVNMRLSTEYLASYCFGLASGGLSGYLPDAGEGRTALVEYVSSNPTGPLTVGHCRQAVLGEAISRLLETVGWRVSREYYFNDGGRQMELLGRSLAVRYLGGPDSDIPEGGYRGGYVKEWADELKRLHGGDLRWESHGALFVSFARSKAMEMIRSDLSLLGIHFDRFFAESELIPDRVEETIAGLESIKTGEGPLLYRDSLYPEKLWLRLTALGRPADRVIKREDGSYTYRMPDIAYHLDKFDRGYDLLVDVFGADHIDTSADVIAVLKELLGSREVDERLKVVIHQFVTLLRSGKRIKMSTRAGEYVTLSRLVKEVGSADVTRYIFLTRKAEAHMDFDIDAARMESSENPVYYVQYAHARIAGILRTAAEAGIGVPGEYDETLAAMLDGKHERELMRLLESVPVETALAAESLEPHRITEMLAALSTGFHRFYQHVRVVDRDAPGPSSARLMLCAACKRCIADLLGVLGVDAPDRM